MCLLGFLLRDCLRWRQGSASCGSKSLQAPYCHRANFFQGKGSPQCSLYAGTYLSRNNHLRANFLYCIIDVNKPSQCCSLCQRLSAQVLKHELSMLCPDLFGQKIKRPCCRIGTSSERTLQECAFGFKAILTSTSCMESIPMLVKLSLSETLPALKPIMSSMEVKRSCKVKLVTFNTFYCAEGISSHGLQIWRKLVTN